MDILFYLAIASHYTTAIICIVTVVMLAVDIVETWIKK